MSPCKRLLAMVHQVEVVSQREELTATLPTRTGLPLVIMLSNMVQHKQLSILHSTEVEHGKRLEKGDR